MASTFDRREAIAGAATLTAGLTWGAARSAQAAATAEIHETRVISQQPHLYHGWATLAQRKNGELLVVCSGGREQHVCPFGRVELIRSKDEGKTWTFGRVLLDGPIDDRDAGVLETAKGSLLVTTFTSLAYEPILTKALAAKAGESGAWDPKRLERWRSANRRLTPQERKARLGMWMIRSTDGGNTWSTRYRCLINSPHGPIQLADGRLLYAGKELWKKNNRNGVCESTDDGQTWRWLAEIPTRPGDQQQNYHELHAVETRDGRLVAQIRNHNKKDSRETLQSESEDGGKTWSVPHSIGVWGLPSHLLRLKDGRLLMSYGHRRPPYGNQARVSEDGGLHWSEPVTISGDGLGGDLGYPSTVELADGSLLTVWYERMKTSRQAVLRQAHWTLKG